MIEFGKLNAGDKAMMIVAHPDDETLWGAGIILALHSLDWSVLCCSQPRRDPIRFSKFCTACRILGAKDNRIAMFETAADQPLDFSLSNFAARFRLDKFRVIVTHGPGGEYGHRHHKQIHNQVRKYIERKKLDVVLVTFGHFNAPPPNSERIIYYAGDEGLKRKQQALACYDHLAPYQGRDIPKYEALRDRYYKELGLNEREDPYDVLA